MKKDTKILIKNARIAKTKREAQRKTKDFNKQIKRASRR